ncbi:phage tail protein [Streptomyces tauricus]|uniref:phage tail tube protein n=1 Tax=Streptomyces tauricus TaxID=68274 RepID=UPI00341F46B9
MATNNGKEIRVAGTGRVLVAPAGTTAPVKSDDVWPTGWVELGYTSVDGIKLNKKDKIDPVDTWQSASPGRFIYSDRDLTVKFQLLQMNKSTLSFFMGIPATGITQTSVGGTAVADTYEFLIPSTPAKDERALGIEFTDGTDAVYRFILPRGQVTETEEMGFTRTGSVKLGVTFTALEAESANRELAKWIMKDKAYAAL